VTYVPIYNVECWECEDSPVVGILDDLAVRSTGRCGRHYFHDRSMTDPDNWNEPPETTE
jgi:hypothetical protein